MISAIGSQMSGVMISTKIIRKKNNCTMVMSRATKLVSGEGVANSRRGAVMARMMPKKVWNTPNIII